MPAQHIGIVTAPQKCAPASGPDILVAIYLSCKDNTSFLICPDNLLKMEFFAENQFSYYRWG